MQTITIKTNQRNELIDVTSRVSDAVSQSGITDGLVVAFVPHTTAGITINENADPTVRTDLLKALDQIVPWRNNYEHSEGNSAAHVKASLMGASASILVLGGRLRLGTWQGTYLAEFDGPRGRRVWAKIIGA